MIALVPTCAAYSDAWKPFYELWRRFAPDLPEIVIATDIDAPVDIPAKRLIAGYDFGWCENLRVALQTLPHEPVLLMQEDFFLTAPIDASVIWAASELVANRRADCVRLYPCPGPSNETAVTSAGRCALGEIRPGEPYRVSCQAAIWSIAFLQEVLQVQGLGVGASAADFEHEGTAAIRHGRVLGILRSETAWPVQYLCSGISRGKWNRDALVLFERFGIDWKRGRPVE